MKPQIKLAYSISLLILTIVIVYIADVTFWLAPPHKKFAFATRTDFNLLEKNHYLPKEWSSIQKVEVSSDASHVQNWLGPEAFQVQKKNQGGFALEVFVSEWIDGYRYGALVKYDLVNIKTKNTIWELNRTYKLGIMY